MEDQNFIGTARDKGSGMRYSCHDVTGNRNKCINIVLNIPFFIIFGSFMQCHVS